MPNTPDSFPGSQALKRILTQYRASFNAKAYGAENNQHDVLMDLFGITPDLKRENRQYWGRELGMCWQLLVSALFEKKAKGFGPGYRDGQDELCDLLAGQDAIDTKYRIGSGDSGTLKKFKKYGKDLRSRGFNPILLIVRSDNLPAAITACEVGGWEILTGQHSFDYITKLTGVDFHTWLRELGDEFRIDRS